LIALRFKIISFCFVYKFAFAGWVEYFSLSEFLTNLPPVERVVVVDGVVVVVVVVVVGTEHIQ